MQGEKKKSARTIIVTLVCLLVMICVWQYKYREQYNYMDSNACWHVLLTAQAYDETPVSTHKFLPIVSLGDEMDKNIQWAEMVADKEGNYYYTSFSAAGFVLPYLFFKFFHLPIAESSLYLFNTILCCVALLISIKLFTDIFKKYIKIEEIIILTTLLFAFQTEIMHGMGTVYWHQSLMQVTLPLQFLCFFHFDEGKKWKWGYYILAILMPYVEWTGFIANVGFALALLFKHGVKIQKRDFFQAFLTGICTAIALVLFFGHFLLVIDFQELMGALQDRYYMRTTYSNATTFNLLWGYWKSFKYIWVLLPVLGLGCVIVNRGVKWIKAYLHLAPMLFVMLFPMLENIVMKDHAISYTYDRMKLVYPLLMIGFLFVAAIPREKHYYHIAIIGLVLLLSGASIKSYTENTEYLWPAEYRADNEVLAEYCRENYHEESLYGLQGAAVRGYVNLMFERGMYENISEEELLLKARERSAKNAVLVHVANNPDPANVWNMYAFSGVTVYNMTAGTKTYIYVVDGRIVEEEGIK